MNDPISLCPILEAFSPQELDYVVAKSLDVVWEADALDSPVGSLNFGHHLSEEASSSHRLIISHYHAFSLWSLTLNCNFLIHGASSSAIKHPKEHGIDIKFFKSHLSVDLMEKLNLFLAPCIPFDSDKLLWDTFQIFYDSRWTLGQAAHSTFLNKSQYGGINSSITLDFSSDQLRYFNEPLGRTVAKEISSFKCSGFVSQEDTCAFPEFDPVWSSAWAQGAATFCFTFSFVLNQKLMTIHGSLSLMCHLLDRLRE
ncbi:hypothetical protein Tco_0053576 [Tanacetum coccineum]